MWGACLQANHCMKTSIMAHNSLRVSSVKCSPAGAEATGIRGSMVLVVVSDSVTDALLLVDSHGGREDSENTSSLVIRLWPGPLAVGCNSCVLISSTSNSSLFSPNAHSVGVLEKVDIPIPDAHLRCTRLFPRRSLNSLGWVIPRWELSSARYLFMVHFVQTVPKDELSEGVERS